MESLHQNQQVQGKKQRHIIVALSQTLETFIMCVFFFKKFDTKANSRSKLSNKLIQILHKNSLYCSNANSNYGIYNTVQDQKW